MRPKHLLGTTLGAAAGLVGGLLVISGREVLPKEKREFWLLEGPALIVTGLACGALVGKAISGLLHRILQRNNPAAQRERVLEREERFADPRTMTCLEGACLFGVIVGLGCALYFVTGGNERVTLGLLWGVMTAFAAIWVDYRRKHPR